jgi:hypothetical protein
MGAQPTPIAPRRRRRHGVHGPSGPSCLPAAGTRAPPLRLAWLDRARGYARQQWRRTRGLSYAANWRSNGRPKGSRLSLSHARTDAIRLPSLASVGGKRLPRRHGLRAAWGASQAERVPAGRAAWPGLQRAEGLTRAALFPPINHPLSLSPTSNPIHTPTLSNMSNIVNVCPPLPSSPRSRRVEPGARQLPPGLACSRHLISSLPHDEACQVADPFLSIASIPSRPLSTPPRRPSTTSPSLPSSSPRVPPRRPTRRSPRTRTLRSAPACPPART